MTSPLSAAPAMDEADRLLGEVSIDDLTTSEMIALIALLRSAVDQRPAERPEPRPPLKLVRPNHNASPAASS